MLESVSSGLIYSVPDPFVHNFCAALQDREK